MGGDLRQPGTDASRDLNGSLRLSLTALPGVFRLASTEWVGDNVPRLGAAVAFYVLLSLAPMVLLAVAVAAMVYGQDAVQGRLAWEIQGMAGPGAALTIEEIVKGACQPRTGVIATLFGRFLPTDGEDRACLGPFAAPVLRNWNGVAVGSLRPMGPLDDTPL